MSNAVVSERIGALVQANAVHFHRDGGHRARSWYLAQVAGFAPPGRLTGRSAELGVLEWFAHGGGAADYLVWEGPPWTGKTALLSWFVLNPPARVRVFPFFVTGRSPGHDNRDGFLEVMLEQFAEFLGDPVPQVSGANREVHFRGMLGKVGAACAALGERALLVVDGLDEDSGLRNSSAVHSIAALLPAAAPGVRVVVASRPNPPVPIDVPEHHPLRRRVGVRWLTQSELARVDQQDMQRELDRLLDGTQDERDLLGLVTVSGGGLTAADLADLGGWPARRAERILQSAAGRTFMARESRWQLPGVVHGFGHTELQRHAERFLGGAQLAAYRERLTAWAVSYQDRGWPDETPGFFIETYPRLLDAADRVDRLVELALDTRRHEWLRRVTGSDATALGELARASELVDATPSDESLTLVRLAFHRDRLVDRAEHVPAAAPALWADLGYLERAEVLIATMRPTGHRAHAITALLEAVSPAVFTAIAPSLVTTVLGLAGGIEDAHDRAQLLRRVAATLVRADDTALALRVVHSIPEHSWMEHAKLHLVEIAASAGHAATAAALVDDLAESAGASRDSYGDFAQGEILAEEVIAAKAAVVLAAMTDLGDAVVRCARLPQPQQVDALVRVVKVAVSRGDLATVRAVIDLIRDRVTRLSDRDLRTRRIIDVVCLENLTGVPRSTGLLVAAVTRVIGAVDPGAALELALALGHALTPGCHPADAAAFWAAVEDLHRRTDLSPELIGLVGAVVSVERARELVLSARGSGARLDGQIAIGRLLAASGRTEEARQLLNSVLARRTETKRGFPAHVVGALVATAAERDDLPSARRALERLPLAVSRDREVQNVIASYSANGRCAVATALCGLLSSKGEQHNATLRIAADQVSRGDVRAVDALGPVTGESAVALVDALIAADEPHRAAGVARRITDPTSRLKAMATLISASPEHAADLAEDVRRCLDGAEIPLADQTLVTVAVTVVAQDGALANRAMDGITGRGERVIAMAQVAAAAAHACHGDSTAEDANWAMLIAASCPFKQELRDRLLGAVAHLVALTGDLPVAEAYAEHIEAAEHAVRAHVTLAEVAETAGEAKRADHFLQRAMSVALAQPVYARADLLRAVLLAAVRLHREPLALSLLRLTSEPRERIGLTVDLADLLPDAAATLLADALREGHLDLSIAAVAARQPLAWRALADEAARLADGEPAFAASAVTY